MTAKLPCRLNLNKQKVIGNTTVSAIQSGFFWGYVSMIEGLIRKINAGSNEIYKIILTGGNANLFKNMFDNVCTIDDLIHLLKA